ncbi:50S ribosomal protein L3 [Tepidiforma thermophila]|uniref:Large ribosomal subunit protein uL3 n=1 Tax=Tepidiforma thermophila (strain KCTC 52669 / CGMCC 1.13589 / G233) TaxID=2761530 RepID=A0A2A9HK00_TEPT2|nr:50S ribosomal protein L3 [Tepidiforma thermophila]PFG75365.1 LSU ribosomal protein L3P [Tepidiforma thermophila]
MTIEGMLGRKLGTTQVFDAQGRLRGVTAVEVGPCYVTLIRTPEKDGYSAIQVGYQEDRRLNKPETGHLRAAGGLKLRHLAEFRTDGTATYSLGDRLGVELFEVGSRVDVTATSKGRGYQGGVKRHGFRGGPRTHGQSDRHRAPGSIGSGTTPGRVLKGTRMAGHMGAERVTVRNLEVVTRNDEAGVIFVAGSVPGPKGGLVRIRKARKVSK